MSLITPHPSVELLAEALKPLGYSVRHYELRHDNQFSEFTAQGRRTWLTQSAHLSYPLITRTISKVSSEKDLAYEFCRRQQLRLPRTFSITKSYTTAALQEVLQHKPLVIKPSNASLSWGVKIGVEDEATLRSAIADALKFSDRVLVQEQVQGEELRFVVIDGRLKAAILREKPRLTGDGTATLAELLKTENEARAKLDMPYIVYPQLAISLLEQTGRAPDTVLSSGEVLPIGNGTMVSGGASIYNVTDRLHPSYVQTVERLVAALGARFIVVDMMLHDYTRPQTDTNYAFIEFNTAPVLKLFYSCRDGKHYDILADLVPMIDDALKENHE